MIGAGPVQGGWQNGGMADEVLRRIDRHMERSNELLDRFDRELGLMRQLHAEYMLEMRDVRRGYRLTISQLMDLAREGREAMREMREASESHTKAILALLDRLENGGTSPAAG